MSDTVQVLDFFKLVLAREPKCLAQIGHRDDVRFEGDVLVFSLRGLWRLLETDAEKDFSVFRRRLFASQLNRQLSAHNARIEVYRNTGKVATNEYCLRATHIGVAD